jgi:hypothetical protein
VAIETEGAASPLGSPTGAAEEVPSPHPARYLWAMLLARIYEIFPLTCHHYGGEVRLIAFVTEAVPIDKTLKSLILCLAIRRNRGLNRLMRFDRGSAALCATPGGLTEMIILSEQAGADQAEVDRAVKRQATAGVSGSARNRNPTRCHRVNVRGPATTSASRQSNHRERITNDPRSAALGR